LNSAGVRSIYEGMRTSDGTRERLRELETELLELAMGAAMPSERDYAEALAAELRRIERNTNRDAAGGHSGAVS
jgi:hypothetical protein